MRGAPWSEAELAVLEAHVEFVGRRGWLDEIAPLLPGRSLSAIKGRMLKLRAESGMCDRSMEWYRHDARHGSQRLLAALESARMIAA